MPLPFAALSLGVSALGAGGSLLSAFSAAREHRRQVDEEVRRFEAGAKRTVSEATARGAASGVEADSGSLQTYLAAMSEEFTRQADWMHRTGYTQARAEEQAGILGAATGLGGALFSFGASNNWWREPMLATSGSSAYTPGSGMPLWR